MDHVNFTFYILNFRDLEGNHPRDSQQIRDREEKPFEMNDE